MVNYTLNITFNNNTDLTNFRSYFGNVTLVKEAPASSTASSQTAWLTFPPWEYTAVSWTDDYYIYASQQPIVSGQVIRMTSWTDDVAKLGTYYDMNPNGSIGADDGTHSFPPPTKTAYNAADLVTNTTGSITMGLAQKAQIVPPVTSTQAQPAPTCASTVLYNTTINWTPDTTIFLYAQKSVKQGSIVIVTSDIACQVQFSTAQTVRTVVWNSKLNLFQADDTIKEGVMALPRLKTPSATSQSSTASPARKQVSSTQASPYKPSPSKINWIRLSASAPNHPNQADFTSRLAKFVAKCSPLQAALAEKGISWKLESGNALLVSNQADKFTELFRKYWKQAEKTKMISIVVRPTNGSYAGSAIMA